MEIECRETMSNFHLYLTRTGNQVNECKVLQHTYKFWVQGPKRGLYCRAKENLTYVALLLRSNTYRLNPNYDRLGSTLLM